MNSITSDLRNLTGKLIEKKLFDSNKLKVTTCDTHDRVVKIDMIHKNIYEERFSHYLGENTIESMHELRTDVG